MNPAELGRVNILSNQLLGNWIASPGLRGVLIGMVEKAIDVENKAEKALLRHYIFGFLFGAPGKPLSSKNMTDAHWYALYEWVKPTKDEDTQQWRSDNLNFQREMFILVDEAKKLRGEAQKREAEILGQLGYL